MKLPPHQLVQGAAGAADKQEVTDAKTAAVKDIAAAHSTTTKYLVTLYGAQVEECRARVHVPTCADVFAKALNEYGERIITNAGDTDLTQWEACITLIKAAFALDLQSLKFEFTARLEREAESREAKANAVATANTDTEMLDATKPIAQIIDDKVKLALAAQALEAKKTQKKAKPSTSNEASAPHKASSSKTPAVSSSSTKTSAKAKPKKASGSKKPDTKPKKEKKRKAPGSEKGATGNTKKTAKGKGKKVVESDGDETLSDSD
ncbi:hypothetical protein DFH09DRAFT_276511 [Mycena vulgaris]|nr:hypothetical protein DFH09DRAFT_276511 [Mycena vulgaris]